MDKCIGAFDDPFFFFLPFKGYLKLDIWKVKNCDFKKKKRRIRSQLKFRDIVIVIGC